MPIASYDRARPPAGTDHHAFGRPCRVVSLFDLATARGFTRTVTRLPDRAMPASRVFDADGPVADVPRHLRACEAVFHQAITSPVEARLFMPYHGTLLRDGGEDAIVSESLWHDELFFAGPFRNDVTTNWEWRFDDDGARAISHDGLVNDCYHRFHFQYFHWLMDSLPRVWLLRKASPHRDGAKWLVGPLDQPFHLPSLALLGIGVGDCLIPPYGATARFERLVVPAFTFEEPLRTIRPNHVSGLHNTGWSREYLDDIRGLAWERHGGGGAPDLRLYVSRGDAAHRRLRNEAALREVLAEHGFRVVEPGTMPFAEQVALFSRASVVVGLHGAGLTNMMWAPDGCGVLELASADLADSGYRFLSNLCGHHHSVILCRAFHHEQGPAYADMEVDVGIARMALAELLAGQPAAHAGPEAAMPPEAVPPLTAVEATPTLEAIQTELAGGDRAAALRLALRFCERDPGNGWGWLVLGRVYRAMRDIGAMRIALRRALSLPDPDPHPGAVFELVEVGAAEADFSDREMIDFGLAQAETGEQKRWYRGALLMLKALACIEAGEFRLANEALREAFAYRTDSDPRPFLFPWLVEALERRGGLEEFAYLDYLSHLAHDAGAPIGYQAALDALPDDMFVLEIGAMDGVRDDTLHRSLTSRRWRAVLVEPTDDMFRQLADTYRDYPNIRCVRVAISDRNGAMEMHRIDPAAVASGGVPEWALGLSSLSADRTLKFYDGRLTVETVEAMTLGDLLERESIERIDVLQIDTEGHDYIVFEQIDFERFPIRLLHIELINLDPVDRLKISRRLGALGYRTFFDGRDLTATRP